MDILMYYFSNLIWYYAAFSLLGHFLDTTHKRKFTKHIFCYTGGFYFTLGVIVALFQIDYKWQSLLYVLLCVIYLEIFFIRKSRNNITPALIFGVISTMVHYASQIVGEYWITDYEQGWEHAEKYTFPIIATCAVVILFITYWIIITIYCLCHRIRPTVLGVVNVVVTIAFSGLTLQMVYKVRAYPKLYMENEILILLLLMGLAIINAFALSYGSSMTQNSILRYRLKKEEEKSTITYDYYKTMEENYDQCKRVLHDVKNHVQVMDTLYVGGQLKLANEYAATLADGIDAIYPKCYSRHKILDIILHDKKKKAEESGTEMQYQVEEVNLDFLSDYHITTLLCNLFDNAITACTKLPENERKITFKIRTVNRFLVMKMENPIDPEHVKEMEPKTLKHRMQTGTGLQNVRNVVNANKGSITTEITDEKFSIAITFNV